MEAVKRLGHDRLRGSGWAELEKGLGGFHGGCPVPVEVAEPGSWQETEKRRLETKTGHLVLDWLRGESSLL